LLLPEEVNSLHAVLLPDDLYSSLKYYSGYRVKDPEADWERGI